MPWEKSHTTDPLLAVMCCCVWNKPLFSLSVAVPQLPAWEKAAAYYNHTQHERTGQMRTLKSLRYQLKISQCCGCHSPRFHLKTTTTPASQTAVSDGLKAEERNDSKFHVIYICFTVSSPKWTEAWETCICYMSRLVCRRSHCAASCIH